MIPKNIERDHILSALHEIDRSGIPGDRKATKYHLEYDQKRYPPKYVISLANKLANGRDLQPWEFSGGVESNEFLRDRGFRIICFTGRKPDTQPRKQPRRTDKRPEPPVEKPTDRNPLTPHDQRCSDCKNTIIEILRRLFGEVKIDHKFDISAIIEGYRGHKWYPNLREIMGALESHRGYKGFVRVKSLPRCDLYIPKPGFVVELDESQHFTEPRKVALSAYPNDLSVGFDIERWITLCDTIRAKDNNPEYRDEQRAWYDALRDILPVVNGLGPTVRIYMKSQPWCSLDPNDSSDIDTFRSLVPGLVAKGQIPSLSSQQTVTLATVVLESNGNFTNDARAALLKAVVQSVRPGTDVVLFPGGFFNTYSEARTLYGFVQDSVRPLLQQRDEKTVICLGIDGRHSKDQIALAIDREGIVAAGRKFHPAPGEDIGAAASVTAAEDDYPRMFRVKGKTAFLAVCYDGFGIRQKHLSNPGVDIILDLVHGFNPIGEGDSGDVYFAKHGFAGSSKQWRCPTFGAAVFFDRNVPPNWPTGVSWNQGEKSTQKWHYDENALVQPAPEIVKPGNLSETAFIRLFSL